MEIEIHWGIMKDSITIKNNGDIANTTKKLESRKWSKFRRRDERPP